MVKEGGMGSIRFEGVSFKYEDRQEFVFRNISFELQEGQKTAFVGASGCGKSTIIQLLLRFYEPT
jgi:ABC-type multidrug transport system fused ATPase/permease subunit